MCVEAEGVMLCCSSAVSRIADKLSSSASPLHHNNNKPGPDTAETFHREYISGVVSRAGSVCTVCIISHLLLCAGERGHAGVVRGGGPAPVELPLRPPAPAPGTPGGDQGHPGGDDRSRRDEAAVGDPQKRKQ